MTNKQKPTTGLPNRPNKHSLQKIVSGGQTGVDRAALDVAMELDIPCGGWCPAGRRAEDGRIEACYPLQETESYRYDVRTRQNITDSDGTLIISSAPLTSGTDLTRKIALKTDKPLLIIAPDTLFDAELIDPWLKEHRITVLNVAGPRESSSPGIYQQATTILKEALGTSR